jgi:hypothetical protein
MAVGIVVVSNIKAIILTQLLNTKIILDQHHSKVMALYRNMGKLFSLRV